jgi:hypothetical protein
MPPDDDDLRGDGFITNLDGIRPATFLWLVTEKY